MSLANLGPNEIVPKTGLYHCCTCKEINQVLRSSFEESLRGYDPKILKAAIKSAGIGADVPVTITKFKAGDKFGVCPRHMTSTGWTLDEEVTLPDVKEKKWWQIWR